MTDLHSSLRALLLVLAASTLAIGPPVRAQSATQQPANPDSGRVHLDTAATLASARADIEAANAVEWGHAWVDQEPASGTGPPVRTGGAYLTVWDRGADGHWRITRNLTF